MKIVLILNSKFWRCSCLLALVLLSCLVCVLCVSPSTNCNVFPDTIIFCHFVTIEFELQLSFSESVLPNYEKMLEYTGPATMFLRTNRMAIQLAFSITLTVLGKISSSWCHFITRNFSVNIHVKKIFTNINEKRTTELKRNCTSGKQNSLRRSSAAPLRIAYQRHHAGDKKPLLGFKYDINFYMDA